jgi:2-hydroxychromene-2-carboxylate isomerase
VSQPIFYFDLGSPFAYLAAERLDEVFASSGVEAPCWQPVSLGALFKLNGRSSWSLGDAQRRAEGMADVECRARSYDLPPLRWPEPWPGNYLTAMRAATFAQLQGRAREFATCAFRNAFQRGHDLSLAECVLEAAQDTGLDAREVEQATAEPAVKLALREATDAAHARGVFGVPTIALDSELFWGEDRLDEAAHNSRRRS